MGKNVNSTILFMFTLNVASLAHLKNQNRIRSGPLRLWYLDGKNLGFQSSSKVFIFPISELPQILVLMFGIIW